MIQEWLVGYREASTAINHRNELVAQVAEKIEVNLELLGATGIEDKLQDVNFLLFNRLNFFLFVFYSKWLRVFRCYTKQELKYEICPPDLLILELALDLGIDGRQERNCSEYWIFLSTSIRSNAEYHLTRNRSGCEFYSVSFFRSEKFDRKFRIPETNYVNAERNSVMH